MALNLFLFVGTADLGRKCVFYSNHRIKGSVISSYSHMTPRFWTPNVWFIGVFRWNLVTHGVGTISLQRGVYIYIYKILTGRKNLSWYIGLYILQPQVSPEPEKDPCGNDPIWHNFTFVKQISRHSTSTSSCTKIWAHKSRIYLLYLTSQTDPEGVETHQFESIHIL